MFYSTGPRKKRSEYDCNDFCPKGNTTLGVTKKSFCIETIFSGAVKNASVRKKRTVI